MAIARACHVDPVAGGGATSVAASCQGVVESRSTCRRERSRIVVVDIACQRVMGPPQGVMEPRRICYRKWNRIMVVIGTCQGARICWSESGLRRSPGGVLLSVGVVGGVRLP